MKGKKNVFVVDCENVGAEALKCIENFDNTEVVLFLSQNVGKDSVYKMMNVLANTGAAITIEWHNAIGKNSLDIKIITYLTLRINESCDFYIISNDKGYLASTEYLTKKGYENVSLLSPNLFEKSKETETSKVRYFGNCQVLGYA